MQYYQGSLAIEMKMQPLHVMSFKKISSGFEYASRYPTKKIRNSTFAQLIIDLETEMPLLGRTNLIYIPL